MRLLLIEDDPSVAGSIELMLTSEDFQVETARLGEDGVALGRVNDCGLICSTSTSRICPATKCFDH
jgi:two-component system, cell cycle response regulator CtrA